MKSITFIGLALAVTCAKMSVGFAFTNEPIDFWACTHNGVIYSKRVSPNCPSDDLNLTSAEQSEIAYHHNHGNLTGAVDSTQSFTAAELKTRLKDDYGMHKPTSHDPEECILSQHLL